MPIQGLGWLVWAWSRSVQIPIRLTFFLARVGAQRIPQQARLLTVVATPPVLHHLLFTVQHLATEHTVEGCTCCKDTKSSTSVWWWDRPTILTLSFTVVGHDVPLKFGERDKLFVTVAALNQVAFLIELPPIVGSMLYQFILSLTATPHRLAIIESDLDLFSVHIKQVHLHVSKGRSDRLTATTFDLQLNRVFTVLLIRWIWGAGPGEKKKGLMVISDHFVTTVKCCHSGQAISLSTCLIYGKL